MRRKASLLAWATLMIIVSSLASGSCGPTQYTLTTSVIPEGTGTLPTITTYNYAVPITISQSGSPTTCLSNYTISIPVRRGTNPIETGSWAVNGGTYCYRMLMTVNEHSNSTLTNYQAKVALDTSWLVTNGYASASGNEVRYTSGNGTLLNFWLETSGAAYGWNSNPSYYWVMVPSIPALGNTAIYCYFDPSTGNSTSVSSMASTFPIFYDDFEGASIDTSKWAYTADATQSGGQIQVGNSTGAIAHDFISTSSVFAPNTRLRFSGYMDNALFTDIGSLTTGNESYFVPGHVYIESTSVDLGFNLAGANNVFEIDKSGNENVNGRVFFAADLASDFTGSTAKGTTSLYKSVSGQEIAANTTIEGYTCTASKYVRMQWVFVSQYVASEPSVDFAPFGDPQAIYLNNHSLSWPYDVIATGDNGITEIPHWIDPDTAQVSASDYAVSVNVKIPFIPSSGNYTIYLYYGKAGVSDTGNGSSTFDVFDEFGNSTQWTAVSGNWTTEQQQKPIFYGTEPYKVRCPSFAQYNGEWYMTGGYNTMPPGFMPSACVNWPMPIDSFLYKSSDFVNWTDTPTKFIYTEKNWIGTWGRYANSIFYDSGTYYIWVDSATGITSVSGLGGAGGIITTTDFVTFTPYSGNPVFTYPSAGGTGGYDGFLFKNGAKWILTYTYALAGSPYEKIAYADADSPFGPYTDHGVILSESGFVDNQSIAKEGSTYYMFFSNTNGINYATASAIAGPWTDHGLCRPSAIMGHK